MNSSATVTVGHNATIIETMSHGVFSLDRKPMSGPEFLALLDSVGLTRSDAARLAGVNRSSVTYWSKNGISYAYLLSILVSL